MIVMKMTMTMIMMVMMMETTGQKLACNSSPEHVPPYVIVHGHVSLTCGVVCLNDQQRHLLFVFIWQVSLPHQPMRELNLRGVGHGPAAASGLPGGPACSGMHGRVLRS